MVSSNLYPPRPLLFLFYLFFFLSLAVHHHQRADSYKQLLAGTFTDNFTEIFLKTHHFSQLFPSKVIVFRLYSAAHPAAHLMGQ